MPLLKTDVVIVKQTPLLDQPCGVRRATTSQEMLVHDFVEVDASEVQSNHEDMFFMV